MRRGTALFLGLAVLCYPPAGRAADTVSELMKRLETGARLARQDAAEALGRMGPAAGDAVPALTKALAPPN